MILINHVATESEKKAGAVVTRPEPLPTTEAENKAEKKPKKAAKKTEG